MNGTMLWSILLAFVSVCGQTNADLKWSNFESYDAGIRASIPCPPKETYRSFQEQPRPIHDYGFTCETEGLRFLLSAKNHQNDFNSKTIDESFESNEFLLKSMFGEVEKFIERRDFTTNGFTSRSYAIELKDGGKVLGLVVVDELATYEAIVAVTRDDLEIIRQKKLDFKSISEKFVNSIEILKK